MIISRRCAWGVALLLSVSGGLRGADRDLRLPPVQAVPQGSAQSVDATAAQEVAPATQAGDVLANVPGIAVRDRANAAQDLQVQSRGFGARSSFGIRGLRLLLDDLPISANDGQGSLGNWLLPAIGRVEVLRGPQALLQGNAAGGVLAAYTAEPAGLGGWMQLGASAAARHLVDAGWQSRDGDGGQAWRVDLRRQRGDGDRPHSGFERTQAQAWMRGSDERMQWLGLVNLLDAPWAQDPLGLGATQWREGVATDANALRFDTRKSVRDGLAGGRVDWSLSDEWRLDATLHAGQRSVLQYLAVPVAAQAAPGSGGGVIDLGRARHGLSMALTHAADADEWRFGIEAADTREHRRGYENFVGERLGVRGALRRDERNRIAARDAFAAWSREWTADWRVALGLRRSGLRVTSVDRYLQNGDDGGRRRFSSSDASLSLARSRADGGRRWFAVGSGFEAPTLNELAYRPDGSGGLNDALAPARSVMVDAGIVQPWRGARFEAAAFAIRTRDDLVPAVNRGGRASFRNAERVTRRGVEAAYERAIGDRHTLRAAATWIDARFDRGFSYLVPGDAAPRVVADGARVPGIARHQASLDFDGRSRDGRTRWRARLQAQSALPADDRNTVAAPGSARLDLAASHALTADWSAWLRVDNALDRRAVGSVIVNEGNARYFEPAPGRVIWLGLNWSGLRP